MWSHPANTPDSCPSEEEFLLGIRGALNEMRAKDLREHLAQCVACAEDWTAWQAFASPRPAHAELATEASDALTERIVQRWQAEHPAPLRRVGGLWATVLGFAAAVAVLCLLVPPAAPTDSAPHAADPQFLESRVAAQERSLGALLSAQSEDGSWGGPLLAADARLTLTAVAAMAVAVRSQSSDPDAAAALRSAAEWLVRHQDDTGAMALSGNQRWLQHHAATEALALIAARHAWPDLNHVVRRARQHAVLRLEEPRGGSSSRPEAGAPERNGPLLSALFPPEAPLGSLGALALRLLQDA
jgi:hypothetical protein